MESEHCDVVIAGAGLSALCVAHFLEKFRPGLKVLLLEKTFRPGGAIRSMREDGFLAEWGPHGFLDNVEESLELLADLKLEQTAQKAPLRQFRRYICLDGKLKQVPQTPPAILKSNLLPFGKKLRVLADLWKKPKPHEQTVAEWAANRFGEAIRPFADIVVTGTFAGDIDKLSIDATYPGLRRLELENGSVFRGAIKTRKQSARSGMPSMISFEQGVEHLVEKLVENKSIVYDTPVRKISGDDTGWLIETDTKNIKTGSVVLALHINRALPIMNLLSPAPKSSVPEAKIFNVVLGFKPGAEIPFGFGYLAPKSENRFALGAMFPTHMFPGRAPDDLMTLEALVGGTRNPERFDMDDQELIEQAYQDIKQLIKLPHPPVFSKVLRTTIGIPQLEIGHLDLQKYRDRLERENSGLHVCGFGWEGIGMNEMIKQAKITAESIVEGRPETKEPSAAKGIYV
ncbi:MAG: protoporphyrinogen oxidase [Proteobacteria bacterium]|nr:protoporphyrinogen oxidase [Pseudomonadota bacterium]